MSNAHTNPGLVCPSGQHDGTAAVLILAGHARKPLLLDRPRISVVFDEMELGRDAVCDSWSTDVEDPLMSRRHARIARAVPGEYLVADLGSTNGTWLDGRPVAVGAPVPLRSGSVLVLGGHVFVFRRLSQDDLVAIREDWAFPFCPVPTLSAGVARLARKLSRLATSKVDVLLSGETGVGKEVHAEAIHRASGRKGPFIAINCAAIPENLVESELFGYARGAHSTAERGKPGLIEQAEGGTAFLDEIGEMSQSAQTKLLRFLQSREFVSLGTTRPRKLDVRVVAATNRPLDAEGREGLRYDLVARLGPEPLRLPPLRERVEDVGILAAHFADEPLTFVPEAYQALFLHQWRGNVRELEKVVALARVLAGPDRPISIDHLPAPIAASATPLPSETPKPAVQRKRPSRDELHSLLARHGGDVASMARDLGRQRTLVWRWLRENQLRPSDYRN